MGVTRRRRRRSFVRRQRRRARGDRPARTASAGRGGGTRGVLSVVVRGPAHASSRRASRGPREGGHARDVQAAIGAAAGRRHRRRRLRRRQQRREGGGQQLSTAVRPSSFTRLAAIHLGGWGARAGGGSPTRARGSRRSAGAGRRGAGRNAQLGARARWQLERPLLLRTGRGGTPRLPPGRQLVTFFHIRHSCTLQHV
jgi:hypothetical protein